MTINGRIKVNVTGARGPSFMQSARATGAYGVLPSDTDEQIFDKFANYAIKLNPGIIQSIENRAFIYGISNLYVKKIFASEAVELAFSDNYYREGYNKKSLNNISGWILNNGPAYIDGRGLFVTGNIAPELDKTNTGDVTIIIDVDIPAFDGTTKTIIAFVGDSLNNQVNAYRSDTGTYAMQLIKDGSLSFVAGPQDSSARNMRIALLITKNKTSISFAGSEVLSISAPRPEILYRIWLGRQSLGVGNPLNGYVKRVVFYPFAVTNSILQAMSGGKVSDDDINDLIDQKITAHGNSLESHDIEATRIQAQLADSKTGIWAVAASDTFAGADGSALGNSEVGGLPWQQNGVVRSGGRAKQSGSALASAWLNTGNSDGQVEGDLYPGNSEASLYARLNTSLTQWLLLQRSFDGSITLNLQFGGQTTRLAPPVYRLVVAGERYKLRFIGPRIWVLRVLNGAEELLFDVTETRLATEKIHGLRLNGGGSVDNFRILKRDGI